MKVFLILSAFFLAAKAAVSYEDVITQEWMLFKAQHGKSYETREEDERRMKIFLENKLFVAQHNEKYHRGEVTFDVELNHLADKLPEEWDALSGLKSGEKFVFPKLEGEVFKPTPNVSLPEEVNWVKAGAVTDVKDQKTCGACYAFSAVGALEGQMFLKRKKRLESLSAQNIVDCSRPQGNQGCNGGFAHFSFNYIRQNGGINSEAVYPYESKQGPCRFRSDKVAATCYGYVELMKDEQVLKEAVANVGPIAINIDTSKKSFKLYKSGVYVEPRCTTYNLDHAVLVVGYGVDRVSNRKYWLVKNSWTASWGEGGYIRMARDANNMCGVASLATYPKV